MKQLLSVFGTPVTEDEALAYWENRHDYEQNFLRRLNLIADETGQVDTNGLDFLLTSVMGGPPSPLVSERAWLTACFHALFKPYEASYYLDFERLVSPIIDDKHKLFMWNTYIIRKPNPVTYTKLLASPYADDYRNHAAFYALLHDEPHHAYATLRNT